MDEETQFRWGKPVRYRVSQLLGMLSGQQEAAYWAPSGPILTLP